MEAAYEVEQSKLSNIRSLAHIQYASFGPSEVIEGSFFFQMLQLGKTKFSERKLFESYEPLKEGPVVSKNGQK